MGRLGSTGRMSPTKRTSDTRPPIRSKWRYKGSEAQGKKSHSLEGQQTKIAVSFLVSNVGVKIPRDNDGQGTSLIVEVFLQYVALSPKRSLIIPAAAVIASTSSMESLEAGAPSHIVETTSNAVLSCKPNRWKADSTECIHFCRRHSGNSSPS
jgi:hypothetical protein